MTELLQSTGLKKETQGERFVQVYFHPHTFELTGSWQWELHTDAVFCSNVMMDLPEHFNGTKGLIHPDDTEQLKEAANCVAGIKYEINFRIVTTYGEVKTLTGFNISCAQKLETGQAGALQKEQEEKQRLEADRLLHTAQHAARLAEKATATGTWQINKTTSKAWYSDGFFHIHGLPPQSLNAHAHTFLPFIHADDRPAVTEAFDKAYHLNTPLHIDYRIIKPDGVEASVRFITSPGFNKEGQPIISGVLIDETERKALEHKLESAESELNFQNEKLRFTEASSNIGYWQINLVTRKSTFSTHFLRLFGLKQQLVSPSWSVLINYVHPEDQEAVTTANKRLKHEHLPPELEYRIVRPDGKVRWIRQRGKLMMYAGNNMVMAGTVQDITVQKALEKKTAELNEKLSVKNFVHWQAEGLAGAASWFTDVKTGQTTWSENMYYLLGYKPNTIQLTQHRLIKYIHPDDRKEFADALLLTSAEGLETALEFRMLSLGGVLQMKASFKKMSHEEGEYFIGTVQNMTEHNIVKKELEQRIEMAQCISENIQDRALITDTNNMILLWNKRCEEAYGITSDEALGKNIFDVLPALNNEEDIALFNRALRGETVRQWAEKGTLKKEYHDLHMIPLKDAGGEVTSVLHMLHDVTAETAMKEQLTERLVLIESLVETSVDPIIAVDRNMNYLVWNKQCEIRFGLKKEDVIGKNVLEVFPSSINDPSYHDFRRALGGELVHIAASKNVGDTEYGEVYLIPVKNKVGEVTAVLWVLHDLSKEIKLAQQQQKADIILQSIDDAYFEIDKDLNIKYANRKAEEFWQKSPEEIIGKKIWDVFLAGC